MISEKVDAIRVFLVDDQQLVRSGFRMLVEAQPDMRVVGEAGNGSDALAALTASGPAPTGESSRGAGTDESEPPTTAVASANPVADVVLMDIRMPGMDGVEATKRLMATPTPPHILVLTTFDLDEYVYAALRAGAAGFLLKDARPDELLSAVRAVARGDAVVAPSATRRLLQHMISAEPTADDGDPHAHALLDSLTAREREVLEQVVSGATNAEIAGRLFMAEATVKTHVGHLLAKLECRDRVGLVVFGYTHGWS